MERVVLVKFSTKKECFKSAYERNLFYRGLYGWRQVVRKSYGKYEYRKSGLLDSIPSLRIGKSLFMVPLGSLEEISDYLESWCEKVRFTTFEVVATRDIIKRMAEKEERLKRGGM